MKFKIRWNGVFAFFTGVLLANGIWTATTYPDPLAVGVYMGSALLAALMWRFTDHYGD